MNLESAYFWAALSIDLVLKVSIQRREYLRSSWFLIDLISTLAIVDVLITLPSSSQGFRFVRGFKTFPCYADSENFENVTNFEFANDNRDPKILTGRYKLQS